MTPGQPQPPDMSFQFAPVQVGDQIMVHVAIFTRVGLAVTLTVPQEVAKNFSKAIKNAVEQAEVTLVKPPSALVQP